MVYQTSMTNTHHYRIPRIIVRAPVYETEEMVHTPKVHQYSVLCYDDNWYQRGVKEAIAINKLKPTLNQDEGRHHLSPIYSKLIRSSVVLKTSDKKANDDSEAVNF